MARYEQALKPLERLGYVLPRSWDDADEVYKKVRTQLLDDLAPVPDEFDTVDQFAQRYHLDLTELCLEALKSEERRVIYRLDVDRRPDPWFFERVAAVRQEIARRLGGDTPPPPAPGGGTPPPPPTTRRRTRGISTKVYRVDGEGKDA